jgi:flagellin
MIISPNLNSASDAQNAFDKTRRAGARLSQDRAGAVANQSRLTLAAGQLAVGRENLTAATSRIQDRDAAEASAESAKQNILAQPGAAMLAQANAMPQSALRLLP